MPANNLQLKSALHKPYNKILFAKEVLSPIFGSGFSLNATDVKVATQPTKSESLVIDTVGIYGNIVLDDGTEITCYEILLQPTVRLEHSKVAIQQYVRKLLIAGQAAIINFIAPINKNTWRLTLVAKDSFLTENGVKEKITNAKRYTYLLGPSETCKTAAERFETLSTELKITFDALVKAFSVEKLSKAFFDEYTLHYQNFINHISIESKYVTTIFKNDDKAVRDFTKKLLGRIVFLYFVQKKGWLGASDKKYTDGDANFIYTLFSNSGGDKSFYANWLSILFFETLNQDATQNKTREDDNFMMPDGKSVKIPFLNGGLFDKEAYDEHVITFKPSLFHNPDFADAILTEKNKTNSRGFLDFLNAFNFTVFEDSPDDHTVAVDPEMLGHIFENLLEDNKDKGAFYTPKEIVHYMCQQSLIEYLITHLSKDYTVYKPIGNQQVELFGNDTRIGQLLMVEQLGSKALNREDVELIVKHKNINHLTSQQLTQIDGLLDTVKICDPAIGSGAFPMGLLQEIFSLKELIAYHSQAKWNPAQVKSNIIQKSIYGVDIEKGAVDIARLRFWLSLVVDEETPKPLPNLDYKIVVGNSLVSKFDGEIINIDWDIKVSNASAISKITTDQIVKLNLLQTWQDLYFKAVGDKATLKKKIELLKAQVLINQLTISKTSFEHSNPILGGFDPTSKEILKNTTNQLTIQGYNNTINKLSKFTGDGILDFFDWKLNFPEVLNEKINKNVGFDIVIGNPPYGAKLSKKEKDVFKGMYIDVHMRTPDTFNYFISKSFTLLKPGGVISFIVPNNLLFQGENTKTRFLLINTNYLKRVINLGDNTFDNADVPTCIFIGLKKKKREYYIDYSDNRKEKIENIDFFKTQKELQNTEVNDVPDMVIGVSSSGVKIMKAIEDKSYKIDDIALEVASGIGTGGDKIFRITKQFAIENNFEEEVLKPVLVGGEIDKYKINDTGHLIIYSYKKSNTDKCNNIFNYLFPFKEKLSQKRETKIGTLPWWCLHWHRNPALFEGEKIILRQTSDSIRATYDNHDYYCIDSINVIKLNPKNEISYKYALILLNSKLNHFVYKNITQEEGRVFAQVKPQNVRKLFIPKITKEDQKVFEILCDYLMFLHNQVHQPVNERIDNKAMAHYIQQIADACVVELIYSKEMKDNKVNILEFVKEEITSFENLPREVRQAREIFYAHQKWTMPNNEVRNRLKIISLMCPDTAGKILNANEED